MKRLLNYKIGVKALAVLLVAGIIVTGVNLDAYAGVYNIGGQDYQIDDKYILDYDNNGVIDETDYMFAYQRQEADRAAAAQAAAEAEAARVAAEQAAAAEAARVAAEAEAARVAAEQAAAAEAARVAAEQEAARIAAEQAAAQKAAEEEAARLAEAQKRAAEEAARQAAEDEAARIAAEQEAQRKAAEEAALKAAEEAAKPVKRDTPNAQKDILTNHRLTNVPENSAISGNNGVNWANCSGGTYDFSNQQYDSIRAAVAAQGSLNILVKALGDNTTTLDSDVQTITINASDFPQKTKRSAANASFDAATSVLSGLDDSKYSIDGGKSWSERLSGSISVPNVHPDLEILVINAARNENEEDSPSAQTIWISKADKPTNVVANPVTKIGGYGSLVNVAPGQEYCKTGTGAWTDITGTVVEHLEVGSYDVRVKAKGTMLASDIYTVSVAGYNAKKEATPNASFDGARYNLYNISCGCAYSVDDVNWTVITDGSCTNVTLSREAADKAVHGNGIRIKRLGDNVNTIDSDWQTIAIAEAVRPSSVGTTPATNGSNGSITGVASDMQYRKEGGNWNDIGSGTVSGLGAGKYYVRRKGSGTTIPSEEVGVTIDNNQGPTNKQSTPNATFNAWIMTLSNMNGCKYSLDGGNNYSGKSDKNDIVLSEGDIKIDKGIKIIRCGDSGSLDSDVQTISLCKMPVPTGISATSATAKTGGMITGVSSYMEYRAANAGSWTVPNGNTIANLPVGTYYVRNRGQYSSMPSDVLVIVIQLGTTPTVVQPTQSSIVVSPVATKTDTKTDAKTDTKTNTKTDTKTEEKKTEATKTEEKKTEEATKTEETAASADEDGFVVDPAAAETPAAAEEQSVFAKGEPILLADQGVQGWGAIEGSMSKESTEPVAVDLTNADTVIPATTIAAAASTDTELILDVAPDMAWSIMPSEITSANTDIDLGIAENTNDIPKEIIAKVESEDGKVAKEFTIKHEGDFGFKAHLTVALDKEDAGKTAKLYYYNKLTGLMEVVDTAVINSYGEATFALTHASSYAVTVNTMTASAATDGDKANVTEKTTAKKTSSKWWIWVIVIAVVLTAIACGVVIYLKKKEEEARRKRHHANHNGTNHNGAGHNDTTHK